MNVYQEMQVNTLHTLLRDFETQFTFWPVQIADFVVRLGEIPLPLHQLPVVGLVKANRVVELSDEETLLIYNDIDTLFKKFTPLTARYKEVIIDFFDITFIPDATQQDVNVLCYEVFGNLENAFGDLDSSFEDHNTVINFTQDHPDLQAAEIKSSHSSPKKRSQRRSKNYNQPIIRTSCSSCEEYTLRLKLLKKIHNAKMIFSRSTRVENTLMASLPPINEIDHKLHEKLIETMEKRVQAENQYLDVELPGAIDAIKLDWYHHMHNFKNPDLTVYVPETDYEDF